MREPLLPRTLTGFVSTLQRPELVPGDDGVMELRFRLAIRVLRDGRYDHTAYHHVVLRDEHSDIASRCRGVVQPRMGLHLHGVWRRRTDGTEPVDEFVVARLYQPVPVPTTRKESTR